MDLAQAAIGPGMAVYTRFSCVLDAAGHALTMREALALINQVLDEALAEQEGDFDADSRLEPRDRPAPHRLEDGLSPDPRTRSGGRACRGKAGRKTRRQGGIDV